MGRIGKVGGEPERLYRRGGWGCGQGVVGEGGGGVVVVVVCVVSSKKEGKGSFGSKSLQCQSKNATQLFAQSCHAARHTMTRIAAAAKCCYIQGFCLLLHTMLYNDNGHAMCMSRSRPQNGRSRNQSSCPVKVLFVTHNCSTMCVGWGWGREGKSAVQMCPTH